VEGIRRMVVGNALGGVFSVLESTIKVDVTFETPLST
jgi:hypothetical protein